MSARVPLQQIRGPGCGDGAANVRNARELLGTELAALVGESYERAYGDMVRVQQLTELEEVIRYSQLDADCAPPPPLWCCGRCCCGGGRSPARQWLDCSVESSVFPVRDVRVPPHPIHCASGHPLLYFLYCCVC